MAEPFCTPRWPYAAPSWVAPGSIWQNAVFLQDKVREVGLCLFESAACLKYGPADLPPALADLPLSWHVHLPLDLPWNRGDATGICTRLAELCEFMQPGFFVLHPPGCADASRALRELDAFASAWFGLVRRPVLLENTRQCDIISLGVGRLWAMGYGLCLDFAHAVGGRQFALLESDLWAQARLVHWSAPGHGDAHRSLASLSGRELALARSLHARTQTGCIHMPEVFDWQGFEESAEILYAFS